MIISKILTTLSDNYKFFASALESASAEERTLSNLTVRLLAEEARNKAVNDEDQILLKAEKRKCYKCGKRGHVARSCRTEDTAVNKRIKCFVCKKLGYVAINCKAKVRM